jgi:hypothetical protein
VVDDCGAGRARAVCRFRALGRGRGSFDTMPILGWRVHFTRRQLMTPRTPGLTPQSLPTDLVAGWLDRQGIEDGVPFRRIRAGYPRFRSIPDCHRPPYQEQPARERRLDLGLYGRLQLRACPPPALPTAAGSRGPPRRPRSQSVQQAARPALLLPPTPPDIRRRQGISDAAVRRGLAALLSRTLTTLDRVAK